MRHHFLTVLPLLASVTWFACSSEDTAPATKASSSSSSGSSGTTVSGSETWDSSKEIKGTVTIAEGATVEIKPGSVLKCYSGAELRVSGTLKVSAGSNHAKISCNTWKGLAILSGAKATIDGLDLENADTGIRMENAATRTEATYSNGKLTGSQTPFLIGTSSKLNVLKSTVVATGPSNIYGDLYMSYVDYDKGAGEGIIMDNADGSIVIEDSTLHGNGKTGEFVESQKGKLVKVSYTTIKDAHCGLHFDSVGSFQVDHITSDSHVFGVMLYGSTTGGTISNSNLGGLEQDVDAQGSNGTIVLDNVFNMNGKTSIRDTQPTIKNAAKSQIPDAKPR